VVALAGVLWLIFCVNFSWLYSETLPHFVSRPFLVKGARCTRREIDCDKGMQSMLHYIPSNGIMILSERFAQ
jgi:hypothetical protein